MSPLKKIVLLVGVAFFLLVGVLVCASYQKDIEHTVYLTDTGFDPYTTHVSVGDTVHFKNKGNDLFWPASDLHPTHANYAPLDPKRPLQGGETWSFTFTQSGTYTFHDHLAPSFEGQVLVGDIDKDAGCNRMVDGASQLTCWDDALKEEYKNKGLSGAFSYYETLFNSQPSFAKECHSFTHTIGKEAFKEYLERNDFDVTSQIAYCSYGFFHGFMEALVQQDGDYRGAREFCDLIDRKIGRETNVYTACLHGIGHGVTDGYDPTTKGDALKTVEPGLALCRELGKTAYEVKICATGVFNSLAGLYENGTVVYDPKNPLAICYSFASEPDIKAACFDDMKTLLSAITSHNFVESAKFIEAMPEDVFAIGAIDNLATYRVYWLLEPGFETGIRDCYRIQDRLQAACVRGLSVGYMVQGRPGEEYKDAIAICRSPLVKPEHRDECFDRTMTFAAERYPQETYEGLCESVSDVYTGVGCRVQRY